jgi:hypothetical protein
MSLQSRLAKLAKTLALKNVSIIYRDQEKYSGSIEKYLKKYADIFLKIIREEKILNIVQQDAASFQDRNGNKIYTADLKVSAFNSVRKMLTPIFNQMLYPINQTLQKDIVNTRYNKILSTYNVSAYIATVSLLIQNSLLEKKSIKKEYPNTLDFYSLDAELYEALDRDVDFTFDLQDKPTLDKIRDFSNDISLFTPLAVSTIYAVLVEDLYFQKKTLAEVVEDLKLQIYRDIAASAEKIATMDITYGADQANIDTLGRYSGLSKIWISVGDNKVRNQHRRNEYGGKRKIYESFAGGPLEISPSNCESPWNCRCTLALLQDNYNPNMQVYNGSTFVTV